MKVIFLSNSLSGKGGTETVLVEVISGLNQKGVETSLCLVGGTEDDTWLRSIPHTTIQPIKGNKYIQNIHYINQLSKLVRKIKPDIIIGLDSKTVLFGKWLKWSLFMNCSVGSWLHFSLLSVQRRLLNIADFHLAISSGIKRQFVDQKIAKPDNVYLVFNPIKEENKVIPRPQNISHFLYLGRLEYDGQKRINDLLRALGQLRGEWRLSVIGDGKDKNDLINLAEELKINQNIIWYGWKEKPWNHVDQISALLLTSDFEGFPMVLGEAMARGIPCISSNCPTGPEDIIKPGVNGWLFPPRDITKLVNLLQNVIDDPNVLPDSTHVKESILKFYADNYISNLIQIFKKEKAK